MIEIENITQDNIVINFQTILPGQSYQIPEVEIFNWATSDDVFMKISQQPKIINFKLSGKIIESISEMIDILKMLPYKKVRLDSSHSDLTGVPRVAIEKPDVPSTSIISHDFCDPCTWYSKSARVEGEELTLESGKTFNSLSQNWIDLTHGRTTDEDDFAENYLPVIYDNGVELVEGQDFTIDYKNGKVTFAENYTVQGTITANFSHATSSHFILEPIAGKILILEHAELNFSKDCFINVPISFEIWVGNPYFNPQEPESPTNPLRVLYKRKKYKNEKDLINAANLGQGEIAQWGNLPHPVLVFPFNYVTLQPMKSSQLTQLIIHLDSDSNGNQVPLQGSWGTATFYVMSIPDPNYS